MSPKLNFMNSIQLKRNKLNAFDLSHDVKQSMKMGYIYPSLVMDCIPGSKIKLRNHTLLRLAPMVAPVMHEVNVWQHYFFVPYRLLWPKWQQFITNTPDVPGDPLPAHPRMQVDHTPGKYSALLNYLGVPTPANLEQEMINPFAVAAYNLIWDEYFRDENLQDKVFKPLLDGVNVAGTDVSIELLKRAWEKDLFTSALPFAQKGAAVDIPLGQVTLNEDWFDDEQIPRFVDSDGNVILGDVESVPGGGPPAGSIQVNGTGPVALDPRGSLEVSPTTISDLRTGWQLQKYLEKAARVGTRYAEYLLGFFGIRHEDARLQRPEYITGMKSPVSISEVLNTAGDGSLPQGNMAGHGVSLGKGYKGFYNVKEHGVIIGLTSVLPRTSYQQGMPKFYTKYNDPFQYFVPELQHIGEAAVLNKEVMAFTSTGNDTFGYQPQYYEYRTLPNRTAGQFQTSLSQWTMTRIFDTQPELNEDFVASDPTKRIFAVTDPDVDELYAQIYHEILAIQPLARFGTPM